MIGSSRIDTLTEQAILGLRSALDQARSRRIVVVCDPSLDDPLSEDAQRLSLPIHDISILVAHQSPKPYLVEIESETHAEAFVNRSLHIAVDEAIRPSPWNRRPRSVCAWLSSQQSIDVLGFELAERSRLPSEHGLQTFRLWDPRTMQHAQTLFGAACSPLPESAWGLIDAFGRWQWLPPPPAGLPAWQAPSAADLRMLSLLNASLQRLCLRGMEQEPSIWNRLARAIQAGQRAGLSDDDDLIYFAADRVRLSAPIEMAAMFSELFAYVRMGKARYYRVVADYDDEDWRPVLESIPKTES